MVADSSANRVLVVGTGSSAPTYLVPSNRELAESRNGTEAGQTNKERLFHVCFHTP